MGTNVCSKCRIEKDEYVFQYLQTHPCMKCGGADPYVLTFHHVMGKKKMDLPSKDEPVMAIQRIVCFKFKEGVSREAVQQHMHDFAAMKGEIPQILEYRGGLTKPGDNQAAPEFDSMHYLVYASMADIDIYIPHEAHQSFISRNREIWEKVLVLNSDIDPE